VDTIYNLLLTEEQRWRDFEYVIEIPNQKVDNPLDL
jgi:hypothetical protein